MLFDTGQETDVLVAVTHWDVVEDAVLRDVVEDVVIRAEEEEEGVVVVVVVVVLRIEEAEDAVL